MENIIKLISEGVELSTLLQIIGGLAPLTPIPAVNLVGQLAVIAGELIAAEKGRGAKTTEEILDGLGVKGERNRLMLLEDLARLKREEGDSPL